MDTDIKEFSYYENSKGKLEKLDSVVTSVIDQFTQRSLVGQKKYGTDLDRKDLTTLDWIEHAKQELMDGILYLEKLKQELSAKS
jgi:hypothetical protein